MPHSTRTQALSLVIVAGAAIAPFAVTLGACGIFGGGKPAETAPAASAAGGEEAGAPGTASAAEPTSAPAASGAAPEKAAEATPPPSSPGSTKAATKNDPAWATCHEKYKAKGKDPSADVAALAKGCAKASKMKLIGKTLTGKQSDSGPPQSYPLKAEANHCYRVFAQAQESIKNLDVAIKDSSGNIAAQDGSSSPTAIVLGDGAVCFNAKDAATVVVSVGSGSGKYAVQIWGN